MPSGCLPAWSLVVLLLAAPAMAGDEFTEDDDYIRRAKATSVKEVGALLRRDNWNPPKPPAAFESALEEVRATQARLEPPVERLAGLGREYAGHEDLAPLAGVREAVRRELEEGSRLLDAQLESLEAARRARVTGGLTSMNAQADSRARIARFVDAIAINSKGKSGRDFRTRLRETLREDERLFEDARSKIAARREAEASRRRALATAGLCLAGGVFAFLALRAGRRASKLLLPPGPGAVVGGSYRLDRELGRGDMGVVFEATDLGLKRKVAVKRMLPELGANPRELKRFLKEARLVAALKHPRVVEIYSIFDEEAGLHLVFELVPGKTLDQELGGGPMPVPRACALAAQVASALEYAHGRGVIHRDLKPANIMLLPSGDVKVMDFGLAHEAGLTVARVSRRVLSLSPYMAPEQEMGSTSRESDLYSLGALLYELLTGKLPFPGPDYLAQKREGRPAAPSELAAGIPPELDATVAKLIAPDPNVRPKTATEVLEALAPWISAPGNGAPLPS